MNHDFYEVLKLIGKPVTYYPNFCHAFGEDVRCALFLSNFYYWEGKQHDEEGWIYKSQAEIKKETGLNRYSQDIARKKLRELGMLEEKLLGKPPIMHYRFNWTKMNEVLNKHFSGEKPEKETQVDPLLYRMKVCFDQVYEGHTAGITYEWSKGKGGGKDWVHLKNLAQAFRQRLIDRKRKDQLPEEVTDDEIVNSFTHFLGMLPDYHVKTNLTPALLYSNFSKIVLEIINKNGNRASQIQSTASQYV